MLNVSLPEILLQKVEWQKFLYSKSPKRSQLLGLEPYWPCKTIKLRVHRNQSFEFVESVLRPYLMYGGWSVDTVYSEYDDSLLFNQKGPVDIELLWLDYNRYTTKLTAEELVNWLFGRIETLQKQSKAPILVPNWDATTTEASSFNRHLRKKADEHYSVFVVDQGRIASDLGNNYIDERAAKITGTLLSDAACIETARNLGSVWIPLLLGKIIKAVVVDLDNTLYKGVLGEDGAEGLELSEAHAVLQNQLLELKSDGFFLAVSSKNDPADIKELFSKRTDFPLHLDDFSARAIGWSEKADGIESIAEELRIGSEAILFIDDNFGEIVSTVSKLSETPFILASEDPAETSRALEYYPGMYRYNLSEEDRLRFEDLAASNERKNITLEAVDDIDYLASLEIELEFHQNPIDLVKRLSEISNKTNQFNLGFNRYGEKEVLELVKKTDVEVIGIRLKDKLADSGLIGLIVTRIDGSKATVEELCISCRALGRKLEDIMIGEAVMKIAKEHRSESVTIEYKRGPRNTPALNWLNQYGTKKVINEESEQDISMILVAGADRAHTMPVHLIWR